MVRVTLLFFVLSTDLERASYYRVHAPLGQGLY